MTVPVRGRVLRQITMTDEPVAPAEISAVAPITADRPQMEAGAQNPAIEADERDSYSVTAFADVADRTLHAAIARMTGGLSPAALAQAYWDWATHLAASPGKRMQLATRRSAKRCASPTMPFAMPPKAPNAERLHRAAAAGSPLRRRRVAAMAVQLHLSELSAAAAMVAQRHDRRCAASQNITRRWWSSSRASFSTWSRRRISR